MLQAWTKFQSLMSDDRGASLVEYALLVVLIAIVAIAAITLTGQRVDQTFDTISDGLAGATGSS